MKFKIQLSICLLLLACTNQVVGQDVHFSQYYTTPLHINPAQTGMFNGNMRFAGIYKNQWSSVTTPYSTFSGSVDFSKPTSKNKENIFGFGFLATTDKAGDAGYTTTQLGGAFSYHKKVGRWGNQFISLGGAASYSNSHFDMTALHWDNEYEGKPANENFISTTSFTDFSLGVEYDYLPSQFSNFSIGAAVFHINQPSLSFGGTWNAILYRKFLINTSAEIKLNQRLQLIPKALYAIQGGYREFNLGSFIRVKMDKTKSNRYNVYLGSWYRWNDALIIVTRFDIDNFSFALSYDVNTSSLTKASHGLGGTEISFLYTTRLSGMGSKKVYCPRF